MKTGMWKRILMVVAMLVVAGAGAADAATLWGTRTYHNLYGNMGRGWNYHYNGGAYNGIWVDVGSGCASLTVDTGLDGYYGDCVLYLRYGAWPTTSSYHRRSDNDYYGRRYREQVRYVNPPAGRWYIRLYALSSYRTCVKITTVRQTTTNWRTEMLARINNERRSRGLVAMTQNSRLQNAAQKFATDMAVYSYLGGPDGHTGRNGSTMTQRIHAEGYYPTTYGTVLGENMCYGQTTVAQAMNWWMNSSGHRANILRANFRYVGFGYYKNSSDATGYRTRWVQDFGAP